MSSPFLNSYYVSLCQHLALEGIFHILSPLKVYILSLYVDCSLPKSRGCDGHIFAFIKRLGTYSWGLNKCFRNI